MTQLVEVAENRKCNRVDKKFLMVVRAWEAGGAIDRTITVSKNVSMGGVLFSYKKPLHHGTPLYVKMYFPNRTIECAATVQRAIPELVRSITNIAVSFKGAEKADLDFIESYAG